MFQAYSLVFFVGQSWKKFGTKHSYGISFIHFHYIMVASVFFFRFALTCIATFSVHEFVCTSYLDQDVRHCKIPTTVSRLEWQLILTFLYSILTERAALFFDTNSSEHFLLTLMECVCAPDDIPSCSIRRYSATLTHQIIWLFFFFQKPKTVNEMQPHLLRQLGTAKQIACLKKNGIGQRNARTEKIKRNDDMMEDTKKNRQILKYLISWCYWTPFKHNIQQTVGIKEHKNCWQTEEKKTQNYMNKNGQKIIVIFRFG